MSEKQIEITDNEDYTIEEWIMLINIGENYQDFKNHMDKYTRDMWF